MTVAKPSDLHLGGRNLSVSMLKTWWQCPRLFYWRYVHPLEGAQGIDTIRVGSPLLVGWAFHVALEEWYRSGWADGQYQRDKAMVALNAAFAARREEFKSEEEYADQLAKTQALMDKYHDFYGPGGECPEYPEIKVLTNEEGEPLIEPTYELELDDLTLTVRPDMLVEAHGFACAMEHKTTSAGQERRVQSRLQMDAQAVAEMAVLRHHLPEHKLSGVYVNVMVKNRGARTKLPTFYRTIVHYSEQRTRDVLDQIQHTAHRIQRTTQAWRDDCAKGMTPLEAADRWFPLGGMFTGACVSFGECDMFSLCSAPGREHRSLANYRARQYTPAPTPEEPSV